MGDLADEAMALSETERAFLVAARRRAVPNAPPASDDPCKSCGDSVEPERRRTLPHTTLCAFCAGAEKRRRVR